jgi:hypothetical protein
MSDAIEGELVRIADALEELLNLAMTVAHAAVAQGQTVSSDDAGDPWDGTPDEERYKGKLG